jgi:hypothetical protein
VPSVKVSRDRRGHHYVSLVQPSTRYGSPGRILYWFRSPAGLKVGREPFDAEVRRELAGRYPALGFDWALLADIPIPPPDEPWREQRRAERSARARAVERAPQAPPDSTDPGDGDPADEQAIPGAPEQPLASASPGVGVRVQGEAAVGTPVGDLAAPSTAAHTQGGVPKRRRRRRSRHQQGVKTAQGASQPSEGVSVEGTAAAAPSTPED